MARPRKPSHLKVVAGTDQPCRTNKREPKPKRERPSPPAHLSDKAKTAWGAASIILDRMGVLTEADEHAYAAALTRNGFFGPDSWYMNGEANMAYAARAEPRLTMPALFLHAAYDTVCETLDSRLAEPMRVNCADLTEAVVESGHWMAQEKPVRVNAELAQWLATKLPGVWAKR